eukprot:5410867-Karenia_brevis.AAC.1
MTYCFWNPGIIDAYEVGTTLTSHNERASWALAPLCHLAVTGHRPSCRNRTKLDVWESTREMNLHSVSYACAIVAKLHLETL